MYSSILIHNKNTPKTVNEQFTIDNSVDFNYSNRDEEIKSIDEYISKVIIKQLKNKEFNIIYIKDNLSSNYLELYGLRVAYHIRLSQELDSKRFVPIVLLSDLDACILNKLEPMGNIVFTKNIYLEPNHLKTIKKYHEKVENNNFPFFNDINYKKDFLNLISIQSPENSTNHSVANEWAIYKWAKELNINSTNSIEIIMQKLVYSLYFKYLKAIKNIEETIEIKSPKFKKIGSKDFKPLISKKTKILYIDDEWDKGWKEILEQYFVQVLENPLETITYNFTNKTYNDVEQFIIEYINNYNPDLIILDMRLLQIDHNEITEVQNISGIKLLNAIKDISLITKTNPGIQVIMFSATSKSIILDEAAKDSKIIGYIKKDSPQETILSTKENIFRFTKHIEESEKKYFLKDIWTIQKEILELKLFRDEKYNEIKFEISNVYNALNSNINNKYYLAIFSFTKSLEFISRLYINEYTMKYKSDNIEVGIYDHTNNEVCGYNNEKWYKGTQNRLHNILFKELNIKDKKIHTSLCELINCRNFIAHPDEKNIVGCNLIKSPNEINILEWFNMLKTILQKIEDKDN